MRLIGFRRPLPAAACLLPAFLLAACAGRGDYPSLAIRDAERNAEPNAGADGGRGDPVGRASGSGEPVAATPAPPVPQTPPSADFTARLEGLVAQARAAHGRFAERQGSAERAVAGGGASGSESWAVASVALAGLDSARSEAMIAMAELDQIYAAEAIAAAETGNGARAEAATAARNQVNGWVEAEDAVLTRLRGRLR